MSVLGSIPITRSARSPQIAVDSPVPLPRSTSSVGCGMPINCVSRSSKAAGGVGRAWSYLVASPVQISLASVMLFLRRPVPLADVPLLRGASVRVPGALAGGAGVRLPCVRPLPGQYWPRSSPLPDPGLSPSLSLLQLYLRLFRARCAHLQMERLTRGLVPVYG